MVYYNNDYLMFDNVIDGFLRFARGVKSDGCISLRLFDIILQLPLIGSLQKESITRRA
jgi:hypothetical protein